MVGDEVLMLANSSLLNFGEQNFGTANLGHKERNACLVKLANLLQRHPGGTLPDKLADPKDYKSMMRFVNRPEATHASVLESHRQRTFRLMNEVESPVVLVVHDQTVLDYSSLNSLAKDLGPIGNGHGRGYLCHNSLAVDPLNRQVLGVANQILHCCDEVPKQESLAAKRMRQGRESRLWTTAVQRIGALRRTNWWWMYATGCGHLRVLGLGSEAQKTLRRPLEKQSQSRGRRWKC